MDRAQLEHLIRASCGNADVTEIVIIGSQAILGAFPNAPADLLVSMEADVFPLARPEDAILIDGAIGEKSVFHETFGYYAHGVSPETAVLPSGWQDRLVPVCNANTRGLTGWCLEPADLAVSKLVAGREKDVAWLRVLFRLRLVAVSLVRARLTVTLIAGEAQRQIVAARLERLSVEQAV